jgi:hypothetical protein
MFSQIKHFFQKQPIATLAQVSSALKTDPETIRPMLAYFEKKGSLKCLSQEVDGCLTTGGSCKGCPSSGCHSAQSASQLFQWLPSNS